MNCDQVADSMDAYVDGELDALTSRSIEQHFRTCANCDEAFQAEAALASAIRNTAPYYRANAELRERIRSSLRNVVGSEPANADAVASHVSAPVGKTARGRVIPETRWHWLALAATIVAIAIAVSSVLPRMRAPNSDQFLATELIASHVRSLMANHLTDVVSSDQHTVKPWLDDKLDFAAPVPNLSDQGFPLVGGRLDYLDNHPVAALVYQRRKHLINLFVWPTSSGASKAEQTITRQGYHLLHWSDDDFNYWAVSDVSEADLRTFKDLFVAQIPPQ
jgi:anti-sigma factor (TIGR02949 family)